MKLVNLVVPVLLIAVPAGCLNLALNKSTVSSDVQWGGVPERGNDGNPNTDFWQDSCVLAIETVADPNPWWQVNLEADYYIYSVTITNRGDDFAWRLANFIIEVYDEAPASPGAVAQVCAVHPGGVGSGVRLELLCAPGVRGQYVRIQKTFMINDDGLQFCEAEVFGTLTLEKASRAVFSRLTGQRLSGTPLSQDSGTAAECGMICFNMPWCDGFNFDGGVGGGPGACLFIFQQEAPVPDAGYDFYNLTYAGYDCYTSF